MKLNKIYQGDVLEVLKTWDDEFVDCIITSPPYWGLRDYGVEGQIGLEKTLDEYLTKMLEVTKELKRVLKPTGVMYWNHGDSYCKSQGHFDAKNPKARKGKLIPKQKDYSRKCLFMQNYRLILKLIDEQGWILRNTIIWHKPNHMPSSVKDRYANSYEPVFMLVRKKRYWFDLDAVRVKQKQSSVKRVKYGENKPIKTRGGGFKISGMANKNKGFNEYLADKGMKLNPAGKNPGDLWRIPTQPFPEAHFATFPEKLVVPMIKSSCPKQICKECKKARVRISKTIQKKTKGNVGRKGSGSGWGGGGTRTLASHKTIGWTDCKCKAGWRSGIVLDPFMGSGTTGLVAEKLARDWVGIELNKEYIKIAEKRLRQRSLLK